MFVVIEGIDGCGKTTVSFELSKKFPCELFSEPTDSLYGCIIRHLLRETKNIDKSFSYQIALLFAADRYYLSEKIKKCNKLAICDRYYHSSLAYQSLYVDLDWLINLNKYVLKPDLTIILDVDVETAMERISKRKKNLTIYEKEHILEKVRENYLKLPEILNEKIIIIENYDLEETVEKCAELIKKSLLK